MAHSNNSRVSIPREDDVHLNDDSDNGSFTYDSDDEQPVQARQAPQRPPESPIAAPRPVSRISTMASSTSLSRSVAAGRTNSLLISPRERPSFSDTASSHASVMEIALNDMSPSTPTPRGAIPPPPSGQSGTSGPAQRRRVMMSDSADITVEPPAAPPSNLVQSINRMGNEVLRFFGLDDNPTANNNNISAFQTVNDPEPPPFTENVANLGRQVSTLARSATRTIRRGRSADQDLPAAAPPSRATGLEMAPPAAPPGVTRPANPPPATPAMRRVRGDDDYEFYSEDDEPPPPAYSEIAPGGAPPGTPGRAGVRVPPPSMAYRQNMGLPEPDADQTPGARNRRERRPNPAGAAEQGEAGPDDDEGEWEPGMTILRDPKIRAQLEKQKVYRAYFLIICTVIQCTFLFYELYFNSTQTGSWIDAPASNWMIGPTPNVLILMGGLYSPCIVSTYLYENQYICPPILNTTSANGTFYTNGTLDAYCGDLGALCGMGGFPGGQPDQWWRFLTAIFEHGGVIHLVVNMLVQIRLGFSIERWLGPVRTIIIYFSSGIFGFLLSALFNKTSRESSRF